MHSSKRKILIVLIVVFSVAILLGTLSSCQKTSLIYFTEPSYFVYLDQETSFVPEIVSKPREKEFILSSANPTIAIIEEDGLTIRALKEGIVTLTVESEGLKAYTKVLVFPSASSPAIPQAQDGKVSLYFVSESGSFPAQRLTPGEYGHDPSSEYSRSGYTLFGWYEDSEFTSQFDFASTPITQNTVLFALWGIDVPQYDYLTIDSKIYIDGFKFGYIPYENVELPERDELEREIYGINEYAFSENKNLLSITIPNTYKEIKKYAFANTEKLETVIIGSGVEYIREFAFAGDPVSPLSKIKSVTILGNSLLQLDSGIFKDCINLETLVLPDSLAQIGAEAFMNCYKLTSIDTPENLIKIYNSSFSSSGITSIDLKNIKEIGTQAFWGCAYLSEVTGGNYLTSLGSYIFGSYIVSYQPYSTPYLRNAINTEPVKTDKVLYIGNALIYAYPGKIKQEYKVKASTTSIAGECFADVNGSVITFDGQVPPEHIGAYAFGGGLSDNTCKSEIIVPNGFMTAYINAFLVTVYEESTGYLPTEYSWSSVQCFYEKWVPSSYAAIQVYKRNVITWVDAESAEWDYNLSVQPHILIGGWDENITPTMPIQIDIKAETDAACNYQSYIVDKIKAYSFNSDSTLETIILPIYISQMESNVFSGLSKCMGIYFKGGFMWNPSSTTISSSTFNFSGMPLGCKIYVPADKLSSYQSSWNYSTLSGRIAADPT